PRRGTGGRRSRRDPEERAPPNSRGTERPLGRGPQARRATPCRHERPHRPSSSVSKTSPRPAPPLRYPTTRKASISRGSLYLVFHDDRRASPVCCKVEA